jgi:hypothetical protein
MGKFAEANVEFEKYLDLKFPANLDFDRDPKRKAIREKSEKRFAEWFTQKSKQGETAAKKFDNVLQIKDAANSIAAFARLGQITQNFSDMLFTAEIPKDVRSGEFAEDKVEAYCDALTEKAEPLAASSTQAAPPNLGEAIARGGIYYRVGGRARDQVFESLVALPGIPRPEHAGGLLVRVPVDVVPAGHLDDLDLVAEDGRVGQKLLLPHEPELARVHEERRGAQRLGRRGRRAQLPEAGDDGAAAVAVAEAAVCV